LEYEIKRFKEHLEAKNMEIEELLRKNQNHQAQIG
jgi:hypothetical protein